MLKALVLVAFTLTLTLGCSNKVDDKAKCGKKPCPVQADAAKADCPPDCTKPCCAKADADKVKGDCGPDCTKPCCAKPNTDADAAKGE